MKKLISLLLILVTILCSCSAPTEKKKDEEKQVKYTVYSEADWSDNGVDTPLFKEGSEKVISYSSAAKKFYFSRVKEQNNSDALKEKNMTIDGKEYHMEYSYSYITELASSERGKTLSLGKIDYYRGNVGEYRLGAKLDQNSGKLLFLSVYGLNSKYDADSKFDADAAKQKADYIIKELYGENTLKSHTHYRTGKTDEEYIVRYVRKIHGYETNEQISVYLTTDGSFCAINALSLGYFEGAEKEFTKEDVDNAYKVLCDSLHDSWTNISKPQLVIDTKGDYYICVCTSRPGNDGESSFQQFYINIK